MEISRIAGENILLGTVVRLGTISAKEDCLIFTALSEEDNRVVWMEGRYTEEIYTLGTSQEEISSYQKLFSGIEKGKVNDFFNKLSDMISLYPIEFGKYKHHHFLIQVEIERIKREMESKAIG